MSVPSLPGRSFPQMPDSVRSGDELAGIYASNGLIQYSQV